MNTISIIIAVSVGLVIYISIAALLRRFWIVPPSEPNPDDVTPVNLHYKCQVCGAEVTMTMAPHNDEEPDAPRHCREDMVLISDD